LSTRLSHCLAQFSPRAQAYEGRDLSRLQTGHRQQAAIRAQNPLKLESVKLDPICAVVHAQVPGSCGKPVGAVLGGTPEGLM
jgi:hypothetical protein